MASVEIFKTEFKGYNKKEVVEYITSLNSQLELLKNELDRVESELSKCKNELETTNEPTVSEPQVDMDALRAEIREELRAELYEEIEREVKEKNTDSELESLREKCATYERQKDIIAELMIKAKTDAAAICEDAKVRSDELLSDTFDKFLKAKEDFELMRKNIEAGKTEMDTRIAAVSHYLSDFSRYLDILEQDIANTGDNFKQNM